MAETRRLKVGLMPSSPESMLPTRAANKAANLSSKKLESDLNEKVGKPMRNTRSKVAKKFVVTAMAASLTFGSVFAPLAKEKAPTKEKPVPGIELALNKKADKPVVELAQNTTPAKKLSPEQGSGPTEAQADSKVDLSKYPQRSISEFLEAEKKGAVLEDLITKNLGPIPDPTTMSVSDFKKHLQERLQEGKRIMENKAYVYLVTLQLVQTKEANGVDYFAQNVIIPVAGAEWSVSATVAIGWDGKTMRNDFFVSFDSKDGKGTGVELSLNQLSTLFKEITKTKLMYVKITVMDQGNGVVVSVVPLDKPSGEIKVGMPTLSVFVDTVTRQVYESESMEVISLSIAKK